MTARTDNPTYVRTADASTLMGTVVVSGTVTAAGITTPPADRTDAIFNSNTGIAPKFALVSEASMGDNELVAAVADKKIRVVSMFFVTTLANVVTIFSDTGGGAVAKSGAMPFGANAIFVLPYNPTGWFETASGKALTMNLSAASLVAGGLEYLEV